jgi:hypothetical protein
MDATTTQFSSWAKRWMDLARFTGPQLPDPSHRTEQLVALWHEPVPGEWRRGDDAQLLERTCRYRRTHKHGTPSPEHAIELEILGLDVDLLPFRCLGAPVADGINAVPLVRDAAGGRASNVEADMLLLLLGDPGPRQVLIEAKANSNNAWYAAVELLRQLRLFVDSPAAQRLLRLRGSVAGLPEELPLAGLVVAPPAFFRASGQKANAVEPARRMLAQLREKVQVDARLAVWRSRGRTIDELR